jgi:predicted RNA-binding protein YlqC (UPF0109 family)
MEQDQQFLEYVVKALVDKPDAVVVDRTVDEMGVLLTLTVDKDDMGKIIGRSGNTAKAVRILLRVVGMKHDARVNLKINEPEGGTGGRRRDDWGEAPRHDHNHDHGHGHSHGGGREHRHEAPANPSAVSQEVDDVMNSLDL